MLHTLNKVGITDTTSGQSHQTKVSFSVFNPKSTTERDGRNIVPSRTFAIDIPCDLKMNNNLSSVLNFKF
jgi:hypothetical protein